MSAARVRRIASGVVVAATVFVAVPLSLLWASRARFGSSNPLARLRPPWSWTGDDAAESLRRPLEDDTVIDLVVRSSLVVAWIGVLVIALTTILEIAHLLRHRDLPAPRRPGLEWAQPIARVVAFGVIAILPLASRAVAAAPVASVVAPPATVSADVSFPVSASVGDSVTDSAMVPREQSPAGSVGASTTRLGVGEVEHVVTRGESVWSIAAMRSDGSDEGTLRIAEAILDRNLDTRMNDGSTFSNPALIRPGWTLIVPGSVAPVEPPADDAESTTDDATETVVIEVDEGDTLSSIAAEELGDAAAWSVLAQENLGRTMPDGRTFDDPDLILPGWELELPDGDAVDEGPDAAGTPEGDAEIEEPGDVPVTDDSIADGPVENVPVVPEPAPGSSASGSAVDTALDHEPRSPDVHVADGRAAEPDATPATTDRAETAADWWDAGEGSAVVPTPPAVTTSTPDTTTTTTALPSSGSTGDISNRDDPTPDATAPLGIEHAAMLASGILTLAAVRRRRRLRSAAAHTRVPDPHPSVVATTRVLRTLSREERTARFDVAVRAVGRRLVGVGTQIGAALHLDDGTIELVLTSPAELPEPWIGSGTTWELSPSIPIELLAADAGHAGRPCPALVAVGRTDDADVLVDLEAAGTLRIEGPVEEADAIVGSIAATVATSVDAETVHLVTTGLPSAVAFDHPNHVEVADAGDAIGAAIELVGSTLDHVEGTFDLRVRRTGGELWEPAVVLCASGDDSVAELAVGALPEPGRGVAVVSAVPFRDGRRDGVVLRVVEGRWELIGFGWEVQLQPFGLDAVALDELVAVVDDAAAEPIPIEYPEFVPEPRRVVDDVDDGADVGSGLGRRTPESDATHQVVVGLLGGVTISTPSGDTHDWQRSKTVELIAWLATHRHRSTRTAARTAMWAQDVRDATFSNVVSEARRGLAALAPPPEGVEWIPRTMTEELPLDDRIVTDADLLRARLGEARLAAPAEAIELLRPMLGFVRGLPFADTSYLWPDADGLVTDLTLLATSVCTELAEHALSLGDAELVIEATGRGLSVLPGHEDLIAVRLRAHASAGDLAAVRREWESYERVIDADAWSDGEPSPRLVALRHELLSS